MHCQLTAVARAGIDMTDRERAAQTNTRRALHAFRKLSERSLVGLRRRLGKRAMGEAFKERSAHRRALEIVSGIGAIERFITKWEVGHDVALDRGLQQRPLEPGRITQVAAFDAGVGVETQPDQDVAAK